MSTGELFGFLFHPHPNPPHKSVCQELGLDCVGLPRITSDQSSTPQQDHTGAVMADTQ